MTRCLDGALAVKLTLLRSGVWTPTANLESKRSCLAWGVICSLYVKCSIRVHAGAVSSLGITELVVAVCSGGREFCEAGGCWHGLGARSGRVAQSAGEASRCRAPPGAVGWEWRPANRAGTRLRPAGRVAAGLARRRRLGADFSRRRCLLPVPAERQSAERYPAVTDGVSLADE